jgi:hypothetical protein
LPGKRLLCRAQVAAVLVKALSRDGRQFVWGHSCGERAGCGEFAFDVAETLPLGFLGLKLAGR